LADAAVSTVGMGGGHASQQGKQRGDCGLHDVSPIPVARVDPERPATGPDITGNDKSIADAPRRPVHPGRVGARTWPVRRKRAMPDPHPGGGPDLAKAVATRPSARHALRYRPPVAVPPTGGRAAGSLRRPRWKAGDAWGH